MNKHVPVETKVGYLSGRDCIFLDKVLISEGQNTLTLKGDLNGNLCSKPQAGIEIPYKLVFSGVLALKMIELDSWDGRSESSFDEIKNSAWIKELGGKVDRSHIHFLVQTYDEVFEVVCSRFKFHV